MSTRVLVRTYREAGRPLDPVAALRDNVIGGNSGNLMFGDAAPRALAASDVELAAWPLARMQRQAEELSERFDHVVLPLANVFRADHLPTLEALTELVRALRVPVTVLGVGAQSSLDYDLAASPEVERATRDFMSAVLERSPSVGVRGEFTARWLASLGFADTRVIGCPSAFPAGTTALPEPRAPRMPTVDDPVVVTLTPGAPLPTGWLERLVEEHRELVYVAQGRPELELLLWGRPYSGTSDRTFPTTLAHPLYAERTVRMYFDTGRWVADLADAALVLGTRIHGAIAGVLAGAPTHLVAHDSRTRELAEYLGIPCSRIDRLDGPLDLAALLERSDVGAPARGHAERLGRYVAYLDEHDLPHVWRPGSTPAPDPVVAPIAPVVEVRHGRLPSADDRLGWLAAQHALEIERLQREQQRLRRRVARLSRKAGRRRPNRG